MRLARWVRGIGPNEFDIALSCVVGYDPPMTIMDVWCRLDRIGDRLSDRGDSGQGSFGLGIAVGVILTVIVLLALGRLP